jgi:hypothetical protein
MKKLILTTALLLVNCVIIAQEIKIKKGKVSIDGNEVAILEKKKLVYCFSSLDNVPKFSVEIKETPLLDGSKVSWCLLTDLNTNKTNEILEEESYQGLNFEKRIVSNVTQGKYKFITAGGIDEKLVTDYINGTSSNIIKGFEELNKKTVDDLKKESELVDRLRIKIVNNGTIIQEIDSIDKNNRPIVFELFLGSINVKEEVTIQGFAPNLVYCVNSVTTSLDQRNKKVETITTIANWYKSRIGYDNPVTGKKIKEQIITEDKKSFNLPEIQPEMSAQSLNTTFGKPDRLKLMKAIVGRLLYNGYVLGNMKKI